MLTNISSDEGVGDGPLRSFWASLIQLITHSPHWQPTREDGYYVPIITSIPPTDDELKAFRAYGLILQTGLLWGMELLPVLPALILLLIEGYSAATSDIFLNAVAPSTARRLDTWPALQIRAGSDPYTMILELDGNIRVSFQSSCWHYVELSNPQISQLSNLSPAAQASLGQRLRSLMVFNYPDGQLGQHPIYEALRFAFQETVPGDIRFSNVHHFFLPAL